MTTGARLVFWQAPTAGAHPRLVFGETDTPVIPTVTITAAARLGGVSVRASVVYDNRVQLTREHAAVSPHQPTMPLHADVVGPWAPSSRHLGGSALPWAPGVSSEHQSTEVGQAPLPRSVDGVAEWESAQGRSGQAGAVHQRSDALAREQRSVWEHVVALVDDSHLALQAGALIPMQRGGGWQVARSARRSAAGRSGASLALVGRQWSALPWQLTRSPQAGVSVPPTVIAPGADPCYLPSARLVFDAASAASARLVFICERHAALPPALVVIPVRTRYMILNDATLRRVDGNIPLPVLGMTLALDADSWTWSFSASLPGSVLPDLEPGGSGEAVEVEATVNGVAYRALVERISRERTFGQSTLRVQGRGKSALLGSPYAASQVFTHAQDRTAQQLMGEVLTINGTPLGWSVEWGLTDWLVPAGVFSHQGSYMSALNAIAGAVGGYVQPHATAQTLRVLPRYPASPWDWGTLTPDIELPAAVTQRESIDWQDKPVYNRVYVSGEGVGVLGRVTRAGTAGELIAPMVTDPLITHADAARQRGIAILGDTGRIATVGLRLPVLAETGIITPGKMVRYVDGATIRLGLVRGVQVDVGLPEIWQSLTLETHP